MPDPDPSFSLPDRKSVPSEVAGRQQAGSDCPHCGSTLKAGDMIRICPECRTVHHGRCWEKSGRCGSIDCSNPWQAPRKVPDSLMVITAEELGRVTPIPVSASRPIGRPMVRAGPSLPVVNRLAIIAFITAIAGIPFFGLLAGPMAIGIAISALSQINRRSQNGKGLAIAALTLGVLDFVGWAVFLGWALSGIGFEQIFRREVRPRPPVVHGAIDPGGTHGDLARAIGEKEVQTS
jgi:Domain of unknown function (DUF4190)/Prokaryotic RING finger family 1